MVAPFTLLRNKMTDKEREKLEKQVQQKLAQANKLLDECADLAEQGGFEVNFNPPGQVYYPSNLLHEKALEKVRDELTEEEYAALTPEALEKAVDEAQDEIMYDELPEYAELGSWWVPSRNC